MRNDSVKILMYWDIKPNMDQEYLEFVMRTWVPESSQLGLKPVEAWLNVYSRFDIPSVMAGAIAEDEQSMRDILASDDWRKLHNRLLEYVENYSQKIVRVTGRYQL